MKLLPQIVFLFNILELCLSKEISIFGQYEHFYHFLYDLFRKGTVAHKKHSPWLR